MKRLAFWTLLTASVTALSPQLLAFCGFYVTKANAGIFNTASQVVLVRDGDRTVITMANDFRGDLKEFAVVIPVPTVVTRDQIRVADKALIDHLDTYTAPRLVEYFDENPCAPKYLTTMARDAVMAAAPAMAGARRERALGVTVEARYTVGEYDIVILSATESGGLEVWLGENGYRIPKGATDVLGSYIKQNMRFFVAKVNLGEQAKLGTTYLRPLQVAYESPKFMLPIRLGTVNASGPQELFVYALTRRGRVETTNYRTVKLPSDVDIPVFVREEGEFTKFYKALFAEQVRRDDMRTVFQEYAWDMGWCDPCAADPLTSDELRRLGVFWLDERPEPLPWWNQGPRRIRTQAPDVFVTRLHVRYTRESFPEDLVFQQTADRSNFQGRYVLRHAWTGNETCEAARTYERELRARQEREAQTLSSLTGWSVSEIRRRIDTGAR